MNKRQRAISQAILRSARNGRTSWSDIRSATSSKSDDWMEVRGVLQHLMDTGAVTRTSDLNVEEYIVNE